MLVQIVILLIALSALVWSADKFVYGASSLARNLGISRLIVCDDTVSGFKSAVSPRTKAILVMLDPIAFPIAVSGLPFKAAVAATIISGAEEPIATMVSPMIIGEIPKFLAKDDAP